MVERATGHARLGGCTSEHIWKPLGMASTTFRVRERPDLIDRLCSMTARTPAGELVVSLLIDLPVKEPRDKEGGARVHTTVPHYLRLLTSLLKNDRTLLKLETVHEMERPQLETPAYLADAIARPESAKYIAPDSPAGIKWEFDSGGNMNVEDIAGRARKGTIFWGGSPTLNGYDSTTIGFA